MKKIEKVIKAGRKFERSAGGSTRIGISIRSLYVLTLINELYFFTRAYPFRMVRRYMEKHNIVKTLLI